MTRHGHIDVNRVYEQRTPSDGHRVLIDRIWPRGLTKAVADIDEWCKDVAPSTLLRTWYGHRETRFEEFRERYLAELDDPEHAEAVGRLRAIAHHDRLTLLTATKNLSTSHARVLAERLSLGTPQADDLPDPYRPAMRRQPSAMRPTTNPPEERS